MDARKLRNLLIMLYQTMEEMNALLFSMDAIISKGSMQSSEKEIKVYIGSWGQDFSGSL